MPVKLSHSPVNQSCARIVVIDISDWCLYISIIYKYMYKYTNIRILKVFNEINHNKYLGRLKRDKEGNRKRKVEREMERSNESV